MSDTSNLAALNRGDSKQPRRRKPALRSLLILSIFVLGTAAVFLLVFGDKLRPRIPVETGTVLLLESAEDTQSSPGRPRAIAQASGWIEADPYAVHVPVKTDGYVESVEVLAGDTVKAGQVVARLDSMDHWHKANILSNRLEEARANEAIAEAALVRAQTELPNASAKLQAARAWLHEAGDRLKRLDKLNAEDRSESELISAQRDLQTRKVSLERAQAEEATARVSVTQREAELRKARSNSKVVQAELDFEGNPMPAQSRPGKCVDPYRRW